MTSHSEFGEKTEGRDIALAFGDELKQNNKRTLSPDGFEMHLATNYLGSFLFNNLIMDKLTAEGGARIVNMSSNGYIFSPFRFADYNLEGNNLPKEEKPPKSLCEAYGLPWGLGFLPRIAYGQSKTETILYSAQISKLQGNKGVKIACVHPGAIATDLWTHMPRESAEQLFTMMPMKTPSRGISTTLVAALDRRIAVGSPGIGRLVPLLIYALGSSNLCLENCQAQPLLEFATDSGNLEKLWTPTEKLVGQEFSFGRA
ncbi:hypothetical protein NHQ30_007818 [Ciborinia camelliae]|nr:hypothetical protein NHQ30_007818 [Ciborinia camelliae]